MNKITFKRKNVYTLMLGVFAIISAIFGYLFYMDESDLPYAIQGVVDKNAPPKFSQVIYGGFGEESLDKPMDVAVNSQYIYVSDTRNKRVQVFDLAGNPVFKFGTAGKGPGKFNFPYGIALDKQGQVYVADLYNGKISVFDSKGKFIKYFAENKNNKKVLESPGGLRIIDQKVYVTDIQRSKVLVFDLKGKLLQQIGKLGVKDGELRAPNAVTADKDGNVYIVDTANQRVQIFDEKGKYIRQFNGSPDGKGASSLVNPRGIGIDSRGIIYVVSNLTHYIHGFDRNGKQLFVFGGSGQENNKFSLPNGLCIDDNNNIYITDSTNQRLVIYN